MPRFQFTIALALAAAPAFGQSPKLAGRDEFFRAGKVVRLDIDVGPKGLESLRKNAREYVEGTVKEDGRETYAGVGVRLRGSAGSFRGVDDKPGFTLNVDKFADGQRFHGMAKFSLVNCAQDPTFVSEMLAGEIYRAAGVPAAELTHAVVTLNGRKLGFYALKEGYDKGFLRRHFANGGGNFYDGGFLKDIDQTLEVDQGKNDVKEQADLKALLAVCREGDHARRFRKLEQLLDLDKFLAMCAVQAITHDWDGYALKPNNYRIYHDPKLNKLTFIPSGMDQLWGDTGSSVFGGWNAIVARALLETPQGKERYAARLRDAMERAYKPDELLKRLDELEARLKPELTSVDKGAGGDLPNHLKRLRDAIPQRAKSVAEQIQKQAKK